MKILVHLPKVKKNSTKNSTKLLNMLYLPSNDGEQKFPESVGFVPHSHFFLKKEHEVEHEVSTKFAYQKTVK